MISSNILSKLILRQLVMIHVRFDNSAHKFHLFYRSDM